MVVVPQGVRGYLIAFVLPPWGWSTGFIATPLTIDLKPKRFLKPAFVFRIKRFSKHALLPGRARLKMDTILRTPEGRYTIEVYLTRSRFVTFPHDPALRAYWTPFPGQSSKLEIFLNCRIISSIVRQARLRFTQKGESGCLKLTTVKSEFFKVAGTYARPPDGRIINERSLL